MTPAHLFRAVCQTAELLASGRPNAPPAGHSVPGTGITAGTARTGRPTRAHGGAERSQLVKERRHKPASQTEATLDTRARRELTVQSGKVAVSHQCKSVAKIHTHTHTRTHTHNVLCASNVFKRLTIKSQVFKHPPDGSD